MGNLNDKYRLAKILTVQQKDIIRVGWRTLRHHQGDIGTIALYR